MKLIRKLPPKIINGRMGSFSVFECPDCLQEVEKRLDNGKRDKSCGCHKSNGKKQGNNQNYKHGGSNTKLYMVWHNMKKRILNPNTKQYKDYGGRSITICTEWLEFIPFRDWALNNGYQENLQINRILNDGNYEPYNCNFVPAIENMRNRNCNVIKNIEIANEIRYLYGTGNYTQKELADKYNVSASIINRIINNKLWEN